MRVGFKERAAGGGGVMFYSDEFGNRINLPPLPGESAIEALMCNRSCLVAMLERLNRETIKNTCKNPMVVKEVRDA